MYKRQISEVAIIGGSYDNIGGHNPIEAIQKNCVVLHGKNIQNFNEVYDTLDRLKCSFLANNTDLLIHKIEDFILQPNETQDILQNINTTIKKKKIIVETEIVNILNNELGEIR